MNQLRELWDGQSPSTKKLIVVLVIVVVAIVAVLIYRGTTASTNPAAETPEESPYSLPSTTTTDTASSTVQLPPGMTERPTNRVTSTPARPSATSTPEADSVVDELAGVKDPHEWVTKYAILWNSYTPKQGNSNSWRSNVSSYATPEASSLLARDGNSIWTGALMSSSTVRPTSEPEARKLWEVGDASMWRVSTPISMASTDPAYAAADGRSRTTWDFYLKRQNNGTYLMDSYADPAPENTNPNTYTPAR